MSLNRIIISVALGISFHGAIISMENEINEQVRLINTFAGNIIGHNAKDIEPLGHWLTQKRNAILDNNSWNSLINDLIGKITSNENDLYESASKLAICNVIEEIARGLNPGQDCSQELANGATEAAAKATSEWIKDHDFELKLIW